MEAKAWRGSDQQTVVYFGNKTAKTTFTHWIKRLINELPIQMKVDAAPLMYLTFAFTAWQS